MNKKVVFSFLIICTVSSFCSVYAFDKGWVLNMRAEVGGSYTIPSISESDLQKLGANKMDGMIGFLAGGEAEIGYIFDSETYFHLPKNHWFSGAGAFGRIGISQGYAGQISGSSVNGQQINVYMSIRYTPVITVAAAGKAYFFGNRLAVGLSAGAKIIADPAPTYEMYSTDSSVFPPEVGTILVTEKMMKQMNPIMASLKVFAEYNVPILDTMELILGGYGAFNIYSPKYITMPPKLMEAAITNSGFNPDEPLKSYFINSFDFGITMGLGFRL